MTPEESRIQELKENGYSLNFETTINFAFENYKKIAVYAGLLIFVFMVLFLILASVLLATYIGAPALLDLIKSEKLDPKNFSDNFYLLYTSGLLLFSCLISPISAGLIKMADSAQKDEEFHLSNVFQYYKNPYFKELFIATFLISLTNMIFSSTIASLGIPLLPSLISIAISFLTILSVPIIIFSELKAIDAISSSIVIVLKQPLIILGLMIISYLSVFLGFVLCFVGVFITIPFLFSMYYALYSTIIGFNNKGENME